MPALNLALDYFDHPKTRRLVGLLGRGAEVLPIRLWCYCGKYHERDGSLTSYSPQEIESIVGWWGSPGKAVEAMVQVGFLDKASKGPGVTVHNWTSRAGHFAKYSEAARIGATARWNRFREKAAADRMRTACEPQCGSDANRIAPERRGEEKEEEGAAVATPPKPRKKPRNRPEVAAPPPPSLEEVLAHWKEKGLRGDPKRFWGHHEQRGWLQKDGNPIVRWKGAAVSWDANEARFQTSAPLPPDEAARKEAERLAYNRQKAAAARAAGNPSPPPIAPPAPLRAKVADLFDGPAEDEPELR